MRPKCAFTLLAASALAPAVVHGGDRLFAWQGHGLWRYELPSGPSMQIGVSLPGADGAACSSDGYVYFAGAGPEAIERWDQDGGNYVFLPMPPVPPLPPGSVQPEPTGLAFDAAGDLYINTIYFTNPGAGAWRLRGGDPANPPEPFIPPFTMGGLGAAVIAGGPHRGALLLAAAGGRVFISEPPGAPARLFIDESASVLLTQAITTNSCGEIFVGSCIQNVGCFVRHYAPEGRFVGNYGRVFSDTHGLDFDSEGNLYVSSAQSRIWKVAPDGAVTPFTGSIGGLTGITICREPLAVRCAPGGAPYRVECAGRGTCLTLDAIPQRTCAAYRWSTDCPGGDFRGTETSATPTLCFDADACGSRCAVSVTMEERLQSASCSAEVLVEDSTPPRLIGVPGDAVVECDRIPPPAPVTGDDACDRAPQVTFAETRVDGRCPGDYTLLRHWTARDACSNEAAADQRLDVIDTTPPRVDARGADVACLWPPDHRYVCFAAEELAPAASDACSEPVVWRVAGCASDQPEDADETAPGSAWGGDGHTRGDCDIRDAGQVVCVRAERAGTGPTAAQGRRYAVTMTATDACGNESAPAGAGVIHVPHDRRPAGGDCR